MGFKSIAVYLDDSERNNECLQFVIRFAAVHGAYLTGFYDVPDVYQRYTPYTDDRQLHDQEQRLSDARHISRVYFSEAARKAGLLFDWYSLHENPLGLAALYSRVIDLSIMVRQGDQMSDGGFQKDLQSTVLLEGGKPVLFLPDSGRFIDESFETVAIAWNGSRECSRAVAGALPILVAASKVKVFIANTRRTARFKEELPGIDIASYLSRHSINVEVVESNVDEESVADWILAQAVGCHAQLLVSGAFGHSRFYKFVWGDVTQTLLEMGTCPLFMAH